MLVGDFANLMRTVRLLRPGNVRSAVLALAKGFEDLSLADACMLEIPGEGVVYVSNWIYGMSTLELSRKLYSSKDGLRWIVLRSREREPSCALSCKALSVLTVPLFRDREKYGSWYAMKRGGDAFGDIDEESVNALSEILSAAVLPFVFHKRRKPGESTEDALRSELLDAIGDELMMRWVLLGMMELSRGEFCAFYAGGADGGLYVMLDGKELSPRVPEIRDKLKTAYGMFSNRGEGHRVFPEKVYYRSPDRNVAYMFGGSKIESYFLVPVIEGSGVRGVLFFGSVNKDAFVRETIDAFRRLADEKRKGTPVVYQVGGETGVLETVIEAVPYGAALVASDGKIICANKSFAGTLEVRGAPPENVREIEKVTSFYLQGVWEEFRVLHRDLVDRELHSFSDSQRCIAVTWIGLDNLSRDVESMVFLRDVTQVKEIERAREEMLVTVAHELRTPMTALKNSLEILMESTEARTGGVEDENPGGSLFGGRFLGTALRTIGRLTVLVNGLIDVSSIRKPDRPLEVEPVDARRLLEDASMLFVESMRKKEIDFEISVDGTVAELLCDRDRMEQVIQNLLSNSLKVVPMGGKISISVTRCGDWIGNVFSSVPWNHVMPAGFVDICVGDTGGGVPPAVIEGLKSATDSAGPFSRPSHGLGLHIADRLMQRHGGALVIESGRDSGTSIHLYLPADAAVASAVRTVRTVEGMLGRVMSRGLSPVLYVFVKDDDTDWLGIDGGRKPSQVTDADREEAYDGGLYFWPVGERFAIALAVGTGISRYPMELLRSGGWETRHVNGDFPSRPKIGWAVGPREGKSYAELMSVALEKIEAQHTDAIQEGVGV
jgi:signal transduction histidine kinase